MEKKERKSPKHYDVIIAGAGIAGTLAASRLHHTSPKTTIALIDQNPSIGGKLRSTIWKNQQFSYGMETLSKKLFEFLKNFLYLFSWNAPPTTTDPPGHLNLSLSPLPRGAPASHFQSQRLQ